MKSILEMVIPLSSLIIMIIFLHFPVCVATNWEISGDPETHIKLTSKMSTQYTFKFVQTLYPRNQHHFMCEKRNVFVESAGETYFKGNYLFTLKSVVVSSGNITVYCNDIDKVEPQNNYIISDVRYRELVRSKTGKDIFVFFTVDEDGKDKQIINVYGVGSSSTTDFDTNQIYSVSFANDVDVKDDAVVDIHCSDQNVRIVW